MSDYQLETILDSELRSQLNRAMSMNCTASHILANLRKNGESEQVVQAAEEYMKRWIPTV